MREITYIKPVSANTGSIPKMMMVMVMVVVMVLVVVTVVIIIFSNT